MNLTPAQEKAVSLDSGKIVLAGAGSGKTTILAERYLRLLEEKKTAPQNIVAMTFTRKAAAQLKSRIYRQILKRENENSAEQEFWHSQRESFAWARIGTIHNICGRLLRAYPMQAGVDPTFTVIDSGRLDQRELVHQHLRNLSYTRDSHLSKLLDFTGSMATIEELVLRSISDKMTWSSLQLALENAGEALDYLNKTLLALLKEYPVEDQLEGTPISHEFYIDNLKSLAAIATPLIEQRYAPKITLFYDDLEQLTYQLLTRHPDVHNRITSSIHQLMVDEFQDTSTIQWEIIRLLVSNEKGEIQTDKLFLVGDEKQAIYGFRSANVTVVEKAKESFAVGSSGGSLALAESPCFVNLNDNFRTVSELIEPMNLAFRSVLASSFSGHTPFEAKPQDLAARRETPKGVAPRIQLALHPGKSRETVYDYLAARLKRDVDQNMRIYDDNSDEVRPLRYDDIAILIKSRTHLGTIESSLRKAGIPYQIVKGQGFFARQEILDILHLISTLADPRDMLAFVGMLRSPFFNFSEEMLAFIFLGEKDPRKSWKDLAEGKTPDRLAKVSLSRNELSRVTRGWQFWNELEQFAIHHPASELLLFCLEESGAWAAYNTGERGRQTIANLEKLIGIIRNLEKEGYHTHRSLYVRLKELLETPDIEDDSEAEISAGEGVNILTMHAAKGLEFPYVVCAELMSKPRYADKNTIDSKGNLLIPHHKFHAISNPLYYHLGLSPVEDGFTLQNYMRKILARAEEDAESKRLLYVAMTRARDHLLMISPVPLKKGDLNPVKNSLLEYLMDAFGIGISDEMQFQVDEDFRDLVEVITIPAHDSEEPHAAPETISLEEIYLTGDENVAPEVRLAQPQAKEKLHLPVTTFAAFLSNPDVKSLEKLLRFGEMKEEKSEDNLETGDISEELEIFPDYLVSTGLSGSMVGSIIHYVYQLRGPGCSWEAAKDIVIAQLKYHYHIENPENSLSSLKQLVDKGQSLFGDSKEINKSPSAREIPIHLRLDNIYLSGKIDLAWKKDEILHIIDYKTNVVAESKLDDLINESGYENQLKLYALALLNAWDGETVIAELYFLYPGKIVTYKWSKSDLQNFKKSLPIDFISDGLAQLQQEH
ncbi:UvrD-helicase domain-containing protein [bacterium]|nr:UvrD-helicase domain-containing protein [bacterium]